MPVAGTQVFKYTRLLRMFLKPLQVDTLFLGYSNLFATNMCIKTFVVHLNCMQYFCNLCVFVVHIRVCVHTYVCTVETRNQHWHLLHPLCTFSCSFIHSFDYLSICLFAYYLVCGCFICMCTCTTPHSVFKWARRRRQILWNWSHRQLWASMWVPETKPRSSWRASGALLAAESSLTHPHYVLRPVSHWTWSLPFRVHWLVSKSPETCSYLSSRRVADICHRVLGTHTQAVLAQQTLCPLFHLPSIYTATPKEDGKSGLELSRQSKFLILQHSWI